MIDLWVFGAGVLVGLVAGATVRLGVVDVAITAVAVHARRR